MCNPPFYADAAELYDHARSKAVEPFSVSHSQMELMEVIYRISG
jgi:23S rRNA A1618 N6-methylase RlmF